MKNLEKLVVGLLAVVVVFIGILTFKTTDVTVNPVVTVESGDPVGAASQTKTNRQYFIAGFQSGGFAFATTSDIATYTLTFDELGRDTTYITWTPDLDLTLTTMASTSPVFDAILGFQTGDKRIYDFYNASTTAAATITFAAGTGVDMQEDEGETVILNGLEFARLTFIRKADTDIAFQVEVFQVGD